MKIDKLLLVAVVGVLFFASCRHTEEIAYISDAQSRWSSDESG